jgi:3D (Asp-Asp-Asp) domain-containing protein
MGCQRPGFKLPGIGSIHFRLGCQGIPAYRSNSALYSTDFLNCRNKTLRTGWWIASHNTFRTKRILKINKRSWLIILITQIHALRKDVDELKKFYNVDTVTVTTYTIDPRQTDNTPTITASGFNVGWKNPKKHRVIAVSRDLKRKLKFGQQIRIVGAGEYDGIYVVHDVMNKRFKKRIDILINPSDKPTMFKNIKLYRI